MKHHIWCNLFIRPAEGCPQCAKLNLKYPPTGDLDYAPMYEKYFPDAIVIPPVKETCELS